MKRMDATLSVAFTNVRSYPECIKLENIQVSAKQRRRADQTRIEVLRPSINEVGVIDFIGVRIRNAHSYEIIYGLEEFLICETNLREAEQALTEANGNADRRLYIECERWAELPCRVFSSETTDDQIRQLRIAIAAARQNGRENDINAIKSVRPVEPVGAAAARHNDRAPVRPVELAGVVTRTDVVADLEPLYGLSEDEAKSVIRDWWGRKETKRASWLFNLERKIGGAQPIKMRLNRWYRGIYRSGEIKFRNSTRYPHKVSFLKRLS